MSSFIIKLTVILSLLAVTVTGYGQDEESERKLTVGVGAELVSAYVWRGMYQAGASFQPTLSLSTYGLTVGAWGSTDFAVNTKELDFFVSYKKKGFTAGIADYWWSGEGAPYFNNSGSHHLDATLGYTFSEKFPLSLEVNTMLSGDEDEGDTGRRYYSTYIAATFPFSIKEIDCEAGIGITPRKGMYGDEFNVVIISAKASRNLQLTTKYALPVFVELILSPARDNAFFVFGIQF